MGWNPYTDQKNRAFSGIVTSLFPEQTKTIPRIIVWSIIFLLDLILGVAGAFRFGLLSAGGKWGTALLVAAILGLFWLQGKLWYAVVNYFHRRNALD